MIDHLGEREVVVLSVVVVVDRGLVQVMEVRKIGAEVEVEVEVVVLEGAEVLVGVDVAVVVVVVVVVVADLDQSNETKVFSDVVFF